MTQDELAMARMDDDGFGAAITGNPRAGIDRADALEAQRRREAREAVAQYVAARA